jgi:predicted metal-dependent enzyme (double-stranded beta helix superfamily)
MTGPHAEIAAWFAERCSADRDLEPAELRALTEELAGRPELWRGLVRHDVEERYYARLHRDHHVEAWLLTWVSAQETGLHDHDVSSGAVRVVDGTLSELRMVLGSGELDETIYAPGESFEFDASRIHDVRHAGTEPAVSLHIYSPPIWRMGFYETGADGRLARRSASYLEELQPT